MKKFEKKINELGLEVGKLSANLNKEVAEFYEAEKEYNQLKEELKDAKDEDVESIKNDLKDGLETLMDFDEMLVQSVETYAKNKPAYDEKVRRMTEGREKKKLAQAQNVTNTSTPITQVAPQIPLQPIIDTPPTPKVEEKKSGLLETLGWGALAIAGIFVGIRIFKNK
jgi:hypothetical protein